MGSPSRRNGPRSDLAVPSNHDQDECRSLLCDPNGVIIAEQVYRCRICSNVLDSVSESRAHYAKHHGSRHHDQHDDCSSGDEQLLQSDKNKLSTDVSDDDADDSRSSTTNNTKRSTQSAHLDIDSPMCPPEAWKALVAMLYFVSVTCITAIVMVIVHDRVPDMQTYPPLPDIFLDNVPLIPWAFTMCELCGLILFIIWCKILIFHKHR